MQLEFIKDGSKHFVKRIILNHDEESTIGIIQRSDLMTNSLVYFAWDNADTFLSLPHDEQGQIINFIVSNSNQITTLEFID